MPPSQWAEYLDSFADYLERARVAIEGGTAPPEGPSAPRPVGQLPPEHMARAESLLAEAQRSIEVGERRKGEVVQARRALAYRARTRSRMHAFDQAL